MRNIRIFLFFFLIIGSIFSGCSLDEDPIPTMDLTVFGVGENLQDWIIPFDSVGQVIPYKNSEDSVAMITVERTYNRNVQDLTGCRVDDRQAQCELQSINLAFPEDIHPDNFQTFISIFVIAPNEVRIIANRVGINASVAILDGDTNVIDTDFPDNYEVSFQPSFFYNGLNSPAIIMETISFENIPEGVIIPPKRMVFLKGIGIIEWEDYNGNTWMLEE